MKECGVDKRYTEEEMKLYSEYKNLCDYIKKVMKLNRLITSSKLLFKEDETDNWITIFREHKTL